MTIASRVSGSTRHLGYLRGIHQFFCNFSCEVGGIIGLPHGRSAMPGEPLVQNFLAGSLGIVLILCTWDRLCELGKKVDDD